MKIADFIQRNITVLDGAMGTLLQRLGLQPNELPERWNLSRASDVIDIHAAYLRAGADVVTANTFGANELKFDDDELEKVIACAIKNAKTAIAISGLKNKFVALDVGPLGKLLAPYGDLDFERAVSIFKKTASLGERYGADLIIIETMNDLYEAKAAVLGAKEGSSLPVFLSNAYSTGGTLMTGASPLEVVTTFEGLGVTAIGANCSFGPNDLRPIIEKLVDHSSTPVLFMPNAGIPKIVDGQTTYDISVATFTEEVKKAVEYGVRIVGGCCGTTPEYIKAVKEALKDIKPKKITPKNKTIVCSSLRSIELGKQPVVIGERINPTGKKRFRQALLENDVAYILEEGLTEQENGADVLDVNVGIPDITEEEVLPRVIKELQAVVETPLQIDTSNALALERSLRYYNGKPLINSVNGKAESMKTVFPLVKKYGGVVVALTLDENGIPEDVDGRLRIAERILETAKSYGIPHHDVIFDTLCMTISTNKNAAEITVSALKAIKERYNVCTVLGVSNISYGLPNRDEVNAEFLAYALKNGLDAAIINPSSKLQMSKINALKGGKLTAENDITKFAEKVIDDSISTDDTHEKGLYSYVLKGQKVASSEATKELLKTLAPLEVVNGYVIPALDELGRAYEQGKVFLPSLLMGAESAKAAFEVIKSSIGDVTTVKKAKFVIATVHGDVHDIGKNIVKLLLENYGFEVIDLGKDVPPQKVVEAVLKENAPLCGLSALMTTTVPAMEQTVKLLKESAPYCKVVVGGAVLNEGYAKKMGADYYAKDALDTVKYAESLS